MACYFMVVNAIAIYLYPGGSLYNYDLTSYSFTENFFSDLGVYRTTGGEINFLSCILFNSSLAMIGLHHCRMPVSYTHLTLPTMS